jgi:hypothetical protein
MRPEGEWYRIEAALAEHLGVLRPAERRGLALWVWGTVLARSSCEAAVVAALLVAGRLHALRQRLREWLRDGPDKAAPCRTEVEVAACFGPLLGWVVRWWRGTDLALAIDATTHTDRLTVLAIGVLYRGCAIPVAWHVRPGNAPGPWLPVIVGLLERLGPAVPPGWRVLVLADRGLWSPRLWGAIRARGWHPVLRIQNGATFQPDGRPRTPARALVPGPGHAWVGAGRAFHPKRKRVPGTLVVVWATGQAEPWAVLTDLAPRAVGVAWYGLRAWIELGFRALKGVGWRWEHTRRADPARAARHWLVLAVATLYALAYGTRADDADRLGVAPDRLDALPDPPPPPARRRPVGTFRLGLSFLVLHLARGRLWPALWLRPDPWPDPFPDLAIAYHARDDDAPDRTYPC